MPLISKRFIDQSDQANVFSFVDYALPAVTAEIIYPQGFIQGDFIYYLVYDPDPVVSKLGRVCYNTTRDDLGAYAEITISCGNFNKIQAAHVLDGEMLYAIFTDDTDSALCSYTMADIEEKFVDGTCGCASNNDCGGLGRKIPYLQDDAECTNMVSARFLLVIYYKPKSSHSQKIKLSSMHQTVNVVDLAG